MLNVLLTASIAFILTFWAIPAIIRIAELKKLYDIPDERKLHKKPIASLGGVGIFIGFFLAALFTVNLKANPELQYFFPAATVIFFLGVKDDILILSATKKFIGQLLAAAILIHLCGVRISSMHGLFGLWELPEAFSLALSYLTFIVIINAFNLIDGVDGLAATLSLLTMSVFGAYFTVAGMEGYAALSFAMAGALMAFLIFNYNPAKIFMGDSGSLMLGLVNSTLVIKFITVADTPGAAYALPSAVAIGFAILVVPLTDTLRVFAIRILNGRSPFSPDRNHIHHLLLDRGLGHKYVTFTCLLVNIGFITVAYFARNLGPNYLALLILSIAFSIVGFLIYTRRSPVARIIKDTLPVSIAEPQGHLVTKVVPISPEQAVAEN
ncbi:undecaprenyl/decaprenyl-phosphate alpha-N-acetylglucosaminyl 1-phosphate transferase [Flaviaesturariibacter flavus]|uniref:Undecaprenyl/decaprenyl-phosphate alpha-N-acetylglucosaminyl 1-phosphate transferase n=1 Tax=Flaviaesturariibacter flavus TaxID=2502780 RepID=A0A4R1BBF3_9BACT|nr:MraY family glycosyltransferase [Flaviaesturariibacter flavus]TCJ14336.1 undecaprenyl/decaprenyl-phosphate alpha-N-acetylglucosaminyl 1-phosphate transferase [Flaviaesturariibacter flavus]